MAPVLPAPPPVGPPPTVPVPAPAARPALPDPRCGRRQVQCRDGPHRPARRRRLEPGPLRGPPVRLRERARRARRLHRERARGRRLRAGLPQPGAQGLRLHHRHVVRLHGPDGDGRRGVPRHHVPPPDRLQVQRQELRQLLRRHRGLQVPRRHARRVARQVRTAIPSSATWPRSRSRRSSASATRSCSASSRPAPSARWTSAFINTWHDPSSSARRRASLFDAGAQVVFTGADTPAVADVAQEKGKWGVTYDHPASCKVDACLTAPYWIWGPEYARIAEQVKAKTYKAGYEYFDADSRAMGLYGLHGRPDAAARASRTCRRGRSSMVKDTLAKMLAGDFGRFDVFAGPIMDNTGKELLAAGEKLEQSDLDQFPPGAPVPSARPACTGGPTASRRAADRCQLGHRSRGPRASRPWASAPSLDRPR